MRPDVRVEPLFQSSAPARAGAAYVTYEPCARSRWHAHPLGQRLHQRWGGHVDEIGPGERNVPILGAAGGIARVRPMCE
jgi:hypothetical protein